jgi:hypothetical protein
MIAEAAHAVPTPCALASQTIANMFASRGMDGVLVEQLSERTSPGVPL